MNARRNNSGEKGYILLAVMLTLTLMLIAMSIALPRIAQQIKREKEEELVHRGKDYATAVKRFVHKNGGRYPNSVEQLENTNHIRFLRKQYKDPMTGEADWKMVHAGEAEIKIPTPNPGGLGGSPTTPPPNNTAAPHSDGETGTLQISKIGNGPTIGGGQIMGVASVSKGEAIKEFNDKDHYDEWYFVYDLRLEQSGGTGVIVAAPRAGGSSATGQSGQGQSPPGNAPVPGSTPTPTPTPVPN